MEQLNRLNDDVIPFRIDIPDEQIADLRDRLAATRWPVPLPPERRDDGWGAGVPTAWIRALAEYWQHEYDWRAAEKHLNEFAQFTTDIDGQRIHFLHIRSGEPGARPLILTHGWPSSIVDFLGIIGPLTDPVAHGGDKADAFDVVVPSLPGFGFSGPPNEAGWDGERIARAWAELMGRLGYERFGAHGGDIGANVSAQLGRIAPGRVVGVHVNGTPGVYPPLPISDEEKATLSPMDAARLARVEKFVQQQSGYRAIQSTRPQTLAYGLTDSPAGQLAWIMDKFREWEHPHNGLPEDVADRDTLLTNASIYWLTGTAGSAGYVGYAQGGGWGIKPNSGVPTAVIAFAHDVAIRRYIERENTVTRWTDVDRGGHFAALEEPAILVDDIRQFYRDLPG
jgi:pimeloyl-ACP methyl ester carboxylesterase